MKIAPYFMLLLTGGILLLALPNPSLGATNRIMDKVTAHMKRVIAASEGTKYNPIRLCPKCQTSKQFKFIEAGSTNLFDHPEVWQTLELKCCGSDKVFLRQVEQPSFLMRECMGCDATEKALDLRLVVIESYVDANGGRRTPVLRETHFQECNVCSGGKGANNDQEVLYGAESFGRDSLTFGQAQGVWMEYAFPRDSKFLSKHLTSAQSIDDVSASLKELSLKTKEVTGVEAVLQRRRARVRARRVTPNRLQTALDPRKRAQ